ncbi:multi-sensor hybrid histidine kinase [Stylonychia lemnae]|uniref:histidine kinase n=1 Tax=Stylonychia lemnae TaxID=5949 RepID=A0A078AC92_STYLE|nr:multi-sensor hybrid histidine kinase [Stylonychia lemnae]|eukprot:CDW78418.1 multi-sensor hybrid histidine kinase [Stylonychia lemnae]
MKETTKKQSVDCHSNNKTDRQKTDQKETYQSEIAIFIGKRNIRGMNFVGFMAINSSIAIQFMVQFKLVTNTKQFQLYDMTLVHVMVHIYIFMLLDISWKVSMINYTLAYTLFYLEHVKILGYENVPQNVLTGLILFLFILKRFLVFKGRIETQLDDLFKEIAEAERSTKNILDILPEGILIFDSNFKKLMYANDSMFNMVFSNKKQNFNSEASFQSANSKSNQSASNTQSNKSFMLEDLQDYVINWDIKVNIEGDSDRQMESSHQSLRFVDFFSKLKERVIFQVKIKKPLSILAEIQIQNFNKGTQKLIMIRDITIFRQREQAQAEKQVQTVFFASVAHDLRTPLNSLQASNNSLLSKFEDQNVDQSLKKVLMIQKGSIQFLINIVEDIMDLSRFQLGQFSLNQEQFEFDDIVEEIFQMTEFLAKQKRVQLIKEININEKIMIYSDKKRIKQVLINLVNNALKFTHQGYVKVKAKIQNLNQDHYNEEFKDDQQEIDVRFDSDIQLDFLNRLQSCDILDYPYKADKYQKAQLIVKVKDTGIGINQVDQDNLFKIFGKLKKTEHINQQGVGLGLNICKKICEFLGGQISVKSEENKGTTFTFTIKIEIQESSRSFCNGINQIGKYNTHFNCTNPFAVEFSNSQRQSFSHKQIPLISFINMECPDNDCKNILVVDDNHFNIMAMNLMIEQIYKDIFPNLNPRIESAIDGIDGLQKMRLDSQKKCCSSCYQLVFIDLNMPKMGGLEMMKHIRYQQNIQGQFQNYKETKFVLSTAQNESTEISYSETGFNYFCKYIFKQPINSIQANRFIDSQRDYSRII